ncbi:MAG: hypothetical protein QOI81_709, partial [Actinomycetota bacterium]|nr:hypothetical protein [Actinomycetota bacterium]
GATVKGSVLAYAAGSKNAENRVAVVHPYFPNLAVKAVPATLLAGNDVALFVTTAYQPPSTTSPTPTTSPGCLPVA